MLADYHVHTHFSTDSEVLPHDHITKAISLGMKEICFTDHTDFDYPPENGSPVFVFEPENYFTELRALQEQYADQIKIKIGVEMGLNPSILQKNLDFAKSHAFDFIIGSSHIVDGHDPFYPAYWDDITPREGITKYFEAILRNVREDNDYNVYGHLDYIRRYVPDKNFVYEDHHYYEITEEILRTIIETGHGIELNTRGLAKGITEFIPTITLLKRYKALGGEILTIGSDAHFTKALGYGFKTASEILADTGFRYYTTFTERKPSFIEL